MSAVAGVWGSNQFTGRCADFRLVEPNRRLPRPELAELCKYSVLACFWALEQGPSGVATEQLEVHARISAKNLAALLPVRPDENEEPEGPR